jgi:hypothetical protein
MKFLIAFLFISTVSAVNATETKKLRALFGEALHDKEKTVVMMEYLSNKCNTPLATGYMAAAIMLMAKHNSNPLQRLKYFNRGKELLEDAIKQDSTSAELRYVRFSFQTTVPAFLGYKSKIEEDKIFLMQAVKTTGDMELKSSITSVLQNSTHLSSAEIKTLRYE